MAMTSFLITHYIFLSPRDAFTTTDGQSLQKYAYSRKSYGPRDGDDRLEREEAEAPVNARLARRTRKRSLYCAGARWYGERTARSLMANGARIRGKDIEDPRKDPRDVKKEKLANSLWRASTKSRDENKEYGKEREKKREKERKEKRGWRRVWQRPVEHLGDITSSHLPTAPGIFVLRFALSLSLSFSFSFYEMFYCVCIEYNYMILITKDF